MWGGLVVHGVVLMSRASAYPNGSLLVNFTGCFLLALIGQFTLNRMVISPDWRVAIAVGFFGGYTTFSRFGWETAKSLEGGGWLRATNHGPGDVLAGFPPSASRVRPAHPL